MIFNHECYLDNPYYFLTHPNDAPEIDCVNAGRELMVAYASSYSGKCWLVAEHEQYIATDAFCCDIPFTPWHRLLAEFR